MRNYHNGYKMEILIANFPRYYRFEFSVSLKWLLTTDEKGWEIKIFTTLHFLEELKLLCYFFPLDVFIYVHTKLCIILEFYILYWVGNNFSWIRFSNCYPRVISRFSLWTKQMLEKMWNLSLIKICLKAIFRKDSSIPKKTIEIM